MYIGIENLIMFVVFPLIGAIAYIFALRFQLKETEKELWSERDKNRELSDELKKIADKKLSEELNKNKIERDDNSLLKQANNDKKHCDICGSINQVNYYPTSGYQEANGSKTYLSGGFNLCDECLSVCEKCSCGKYKIPFFLNEYIGGIMEHPKFCKCDEPKEEQERRYKRENSKLQILLLKQKINNRF